MAFNNPPPSPPYKLQTLEKPDTPVSLTPGVEAVEVEGCNFILLSIENPPAQPSSIEPHVEEAQEHQGKTSASTSAKVTDTECVRQKIYHLIRLKHLSLCRENLASTLRKRA